MTAHRSTAHDSIAFGLALYFSQHPHAVIKSTDVCGLVGCRSASVTTCLQASVDDGLFVATKQKPGKANLYRAGPALFAAIEWCSNFVPGVTPPAARKQVVRVAKPLPKKVMPPSSIFAMAGRMAEAEGLGA